MSCSRLDSLVKLEKFHQLDSSSISEVWAAHFSEKPGNFGVSIPSTLANPIKSRLEQYSMFILPINRLTGNEIMLTEAVSGDENFVVQATSLDEYKKLGPLAPTRASFTFFTELKGVKDLILVHGRFDESQMNHSLSNALLQNFCAAYCNDGLFQWVQNFSDRPNEFDFSQFMETFSQK